MVNASLNWTSIGGLILLALWIPALVASLRRFDALMRRDQSNVSLQGWELALLLINVAGRAIALPLVAGILFFQGWRLDPILQFGVGLLMLGMIFESIRTIGIDSHELDRVIQTDTHKSVRQLVLERRLQDRVWPWSIAHCLLPFAGIYYAITRRTITPMLWDFIARFILLLASAGVLVLTNILLPVDAELMIQGELSSAGWVKICFHVIEFLLIILANIVAGVLPVRAAIRRTQVDARRRLELSA